jgi:hypothetical protein
MEAIKHIDNLGRKAKDKVTGFSGVIESVGFDLYGCVQYVIVPEAKEGRDYGDSRWFDVTRLEVSGKPVMDLPDFDIGYVAEGKKGPADKPIM